MGPGFRTLLERLTPMRHLFGAIDLALLGYGRGETVDLLAGRATLVDAHPGGDDVWEEGKGWFALRTRLDIKLLRQFVAECQCPASVGT